MGGGGGGVKGRGGGQHRKGQCKGHLKFKFMLLLIYKVQHESKIIRYPLKYHGNLFQACLFHLLIFFAVKLTRQLIIVTVMVETILNLSRQISTHFPL